MCVHMHTRTRMWEAPGWAWRFGGLSCANPPGPAFRWSLDGPWGWGRRQGLSLQQLSEKQTLKNSVKNAFQLWTHFPASHISLFTDMPSWLLQPLE